MAEVELFRPSNGTIGSIFCEDFCYRCQHDWEKCEILTHTLIHSIDEPEYPREWITDARGSRCTAFRRQGILTDIADKRQMELAL